MHFANRLYLFFKGSSKKEHLYRHKAFPFAIRVSSCLSCSIFLSAARSVPAITKMSSQVLVFLFIRTWGHWGSFHSELTDLSACFIYPLVCKQIGNTNTSLHALPRKENPAENLLINLFCSVISAIPNKPSRFCNTGSERAARFTFQYEWKGFKIPLDINRGSKIYCY